MLLSLPAQAGLPTLLVREVARYDARSDWSLLAGLLRRANQAVGVLAVLICGAAVAVVLGFGQASTNEERATFLWTLTLLPLFALGNLRGAALRGLRRVVQGQLPEYVVRPGLFVFALLVVVAVRQLAPAAGLDLAPSSAMALHAMAALLAFAAGVWLLRRELPSAVRRAAPSYATRTWLKSLLPLTLLAGMTLINSQMDVVLLGLLGTTSDVGVYRVAWSASMPIVFSLSAVNLVIAPYFSRAHASGDSAVLQRLATWSARVAGAVAVPAAAVLVLFGSAILGFVFGSEFVAGGTALGILAAGQLCNAAAGSVGTILNMTGNERDTLFGVAVAALVNLGLNLALIPTYGIDGAAIATASSLVLWNVILVLRVKKRVGVVSLAWFPRPDV